MSVFLTGGTGYLGSYVCRDLLADTDTRLALLVRGKDHEQAVAKLWKAWQLHMDPESFRTALARVDIVLGDLHSPELGIDPAQRKELLESVDSVLHIAASLNRKSSKACFNTNLRGTLSVINLAKEIHEHKGLRRYGHVSTVAVAGQRDREDVQEDDAIDWNRSDYDPYGRTKKFCEHMARELLPSVRKVFFRPSIVMGDTTKARTSQFDMVRAFCTIADLPVIPFSGDVRLDIVPADYVGGAIASIHMDEDAEHDIYHLSSGRNSQTAREIAAAITAARGGRTPTFVPSLEGGFDKVISAMNRAPRGTTVAGIGALLKVFLPYITYDTVFVNDRVVEHMGHTPAPFTTYAAELYTWSKQVKFKYPHQPLPEVL